MKKIFKVAKRFAASPRKIDLLVDTANAIRKNGLKGGAKFIRELYQLKNGIPAIDISEPIFLNKEMFFNQSNVIKLQSCVDIVIPVYNGFDFLESLFLSIYHSTTSYHRIIVINDCSPDVRVREFLDNIHKYKNQYCEEIIVSHNVENLGFVKTVNFAFKYINNNFVILNTDTEVPYGWLERLMQPFETQQNIASITPFTNAGTICSFPVWLTDNQLPFGLDCNAVDEVFHNVNLATTQQEIPTGVGFCMGMNKAVVDEIGLFDADTFGKGYGEENDWCQRAIKAGYKNIHVTNLFVYHKHGGSFGNSKLQLIKENYTKLINKHPNYDRDVAKYIQKNSLADLRSCLLLKLAIQQNDTVLVFDHGLGGGASKYLEENILANHKVNIIVNGFHNKAEILIRIFDISKELSRCKFESLQYFYDNFIFEKTFKHVHINHLLTIDNLTLVNDIITNHAKSSTYLVHDFLAVCPSYTLINNEGKYCGTQVDTDICNKCQLNNQYQRRNDNQYLNMQSWRDIYYQILSSVKNILCFSQDSVNHLVKIYPLLSNKIEIKPHKVKTKITSFNSKVSLVNKDKINVAVLGAINYQKGRGIIQELVKLQLFSKKIFNLIIIGYADVSFINNCVIHGKYDPEVLSELVKKYKVDIFIIPSIWPETFCYTAEEVMMLEFPLISFNIGAHAERIINYEHGYLCDEVSAISLYNKIIDVSKKYGFSFICQK